jgi:hypothetical protein
MSGIKSPEKTRPRWLLVEGDDDKFVAINLLRRHGEHFGDESAEAPVHIPFVRAAGGLSKLWPLARIELKSRRRFGIILDADLDEGRAWDLLRKELGSIPDPPEWVTAAVSALPADLPPTGVVIEQGERSEFALGVWIMPNNGAAGTLDDFLIDLIPPEDPHWPHAMSAVADASARGTTFKAQYASKAQVHTWLAWQKDPGVPYGRAVESAYFDHDTPSARAFVAWFKRMFPADR